MITIERNTVSTVIVELKKDGKPVPLTGGESLTWALITKQGQVIANKQTPVDLTATGTNLKTGAIVITIDGTTDPYQAEFATRDDVILCVSGFPVGRAMFPAEIKEPFELTRSQLFIKELVIPQMREDQLMAASAGALRDMKVTDDYIWRKLIAAEAEIARRLRVFLVPTRVFQSEPTEDQIAELNGEPWVKDTPQDYEPTMFDRDKWGYFVTRHHPVVAVQRLRFIMPSAGGQYFDIPQEWLRVDQKYGHVEIIPVTNATLVTTSVLGFTALTWQSRIPQMVHLDYTAGLVDAATQYPDLIDAIMKLAVTKIITDTFLPQSGSISADGLSESMSVDLSKYQDQIDRIIDGPEKSGNGGLQAAIHGVRSMIF